MDPRRVVVGCAVFVCVISTVTCGAIMYGKSRMLPATGPFVRTLPKHKRIPRVVFKTGPLPKSHEFVAPLLTAIRRLNPHIQVRYYNDSEARQYFGSRCGTYALKAYDSLVSGSIRADLFRYCALWSEGGIYSDLSHEFQVPIGDLVDFERDELVLVRDRLRWRSFLSSVTPIQISFMAVTPQHPIMRTVLLRAIDNVEQQFYGKSSLEVTGPLLFGKVLHENLGAFQFKMQLEDVGGALANIKTGKIAVVTKKGGLKEAHLRLNGTARYGNLWAKRTLYWQS